MIRIGRMAGRIGCCDADCAGSNGCRIGGIQCAKCGRYFCANEINEDGVCDSCAPYDEDEEEEDGDDGRDILGMPEERY